ncbi:MAG: N-acetylmuramoyl-L-alanine amidase [Xanthomonadales bacterium]|nr:N-acetylmuramoyl-L-alanine amidase [Xanthomonadales bacterium]
MNRRPPGIMCSTETDDIDQGTLVRSCMYPPGILGYPTILYCRLIKELYLILGMYGNAEIVDKTKEVNEGIRDFDKHDNVTSTLEARDKIFVKKKVFGDNPATPNRVEDNFYTGKRKRSLSNRKIRDLADIDSLVLHQTSVLRNDPHDITKYFKISVHFIIVPDGTIYRLYDNEVKCNGSSGFNGRSVSVEFEGKFRHDRKNGGVGKNKPTLAQLRSGRKLIVYLKKKLTNFKYVLAHSQSANKNCPGPEIWYNVGEWAIKKGLCLASGRDIKEGSGKAIPDSWKNGEVKRKNKVIRSFKINVPII